MKKMLVIDSIFYYCSGDFYNYRNGGRNLSMNKKNAKNKAVKQPESTPVRISLELFGEEGDLFLQVKQRKYIINNTELARMILLPGLKTELEKLDREIAA